jgi:uncharacterized protein
MAAKKSEASARLCPICSKPATPDSYPFCSTRCADVDLHRWLGGVYVIPSDEEDDEAAPGPNEGDAVQ